MLLAIADTEDAALDISTRGMNGLMRRTQRKYCRIGESFSP